MSSELLATPRPNQGVDPFHIGTRYVKCVDANGKPDVKLVPLSEEDFLHPQEEDRLMLTNAHSIAVWYLRQSIVQACRARPLVRVFSDHRIDWQHPDIAPHGPDVVVFDRFTAEWDELRGTLPVADLGLEVIAVFEVTSESTRHIDLDKKFIEYAVVGIPYYIVVDVAEPNGEPNVRGSPVDVAVHRHGPEAEVAAGAHPAFELGAVDEAARRVARVRQEERAEAAARDLVA